MSRQDLQLLLGNLGEIAHLPEGVERVRKTILDLATSGQLIPQDPSEGTGSDALERIKLDQVKRADTVRRKTAVFAPVVDDEKPFEVPSSWTWARLGEVAMFIDYRGRTPTKVASGVRLITAKNVRTGYLRRKPEEFIATDSYASWMTRGLPRLDDVLFTTEAPLANVALFDFTEPIALAQRIICLSPFAGLSGRFLSFLLMAPAIQNMILARATGTTVSGIRAAQLKLVPIPIPPLSEQLRISMLMEETFDLLSCLSESLVDEEQDRLELSRVAFRRLAGSTDRTGLDLIYELVRTSGDAGRLEAAVISLATRGRLVGQNCSDGSGADLLVDIGRRLKQTERKHRAQSSVQHWAEPFTIPPTWVWTSLSQVGEINPRNVVRDDCEVSFTPMAMVSEEFGAELRSEATTWGEVKASFTHIADGDVVVAKITPCFENSKAGVARGLRNGVGAATTELHVFRNQTGLIDPDYVYLWFKSQTFMEFGASQMTGTAGQKRVPRAFVADFPFPLPPLAEQRRIVAKVQHIMALVNRVRAVLSAAT